MDFREGDDINDDDRVGGGDARDGGSSGAPEPSPGAPAAKETLTTAQVMRIVMALRVVGDKAMIEKIQDEANATGDERLALGQVGAALREALARGLVERVGEQWTAIRPGVLAFRRGALLGKAAEEGMRGSRILLAGAELHDAQALGAAGLAIFLAGGDDPEADVGSLSVKEEDARNLIGRGAIQAVGEVMPECRVPATLTTITLAPDATDEQTKEAIAQISRERDEAIERAKKLEESEAKRARLRAFIAARGVNAAEIEDPAPTPTPAAETMPAPPGSRSATWKKKVAIDVGERARLLLEVFEQTDKISRLRREQAASKERNATAQAGYKEALNASVDRLEQLRLEHDSGERTVEREAHVVTDWAKDEEVWTDAKSGEVLERRKIPPPGPLFANKAGAPPAAPSTPPGASPFKPTTPEPAGTPSNAPALTKENVLAALLDLVKSLGPDELITTTEATDRLAKQWGIEAGTELGQLVKAAGRAGHKAGTLHWAAEGGVEKIGAPRAKAPAADHVAAVLDALKAGPLSKVELMGKAHLGKDVLEKLLKQLIDEGKIETDGAGRGTKYKLVGCAS